MCRFCINKKVIKLAFITGKSFVRTVRIIAIICMSALVTVRLTGHTIWDTTQVKISILNFFWEKKDGWGVKGEGGEIYTNGQPVAKATTSYGNDDLIGMLLDMDKYTLTMFINKKQVLEYTNKDWEVKKWELGECNSYIGKNYISIDFIDSRSRFGWNQF